MSSLVSPGFVTVVASADPPKLTAVTPSKQYFWHENEPGLVVEPEPAWGRDVDHEEAHEARAEAVAAGQPSYTVRSSSGRAGKTFWVCTAPAPACMPRCVQPVQGCRHGARPSGAAYQAGKRLGHEVQVQRGAGASRIDAGWRLLWLRMNVMRRWCRRERRQERRQRRQRKRVVTRGG